MLNQQDVLKDRIEARKHELLAKFDALKADARADAIATRTKVKEKLAVLEHDLAAGWDKIDDAIRAKLTKWLDSDHA